MIGKHTMITKVVQDIESGKMLSRRLRWTDLPFARAMGVRNPSVFSNVAQGAPAAAAETIIGQIGPINLSVDNAQVLVYWYYATVIGTAGVTCITRVRRGLLVTSPQVTLGSPALTVVAGNAVQFSGFYGDSPGIVANLFYVLTQQVGSATGASSIADIGFGAIVL